MAVDGAMHDMTSTAVWIQAGRAVQMAVTGKAVAIGGEMKLYPGLGAQYTSSYAAPSLRVYDPLDAINHVNNATFVRVCLYSLYSCKFTEYTMRTGVGSVRE